MFRTSLIDTERGQFELFKKGKGPPLAFTHLYSEFNEKGRIMSQDLSEHYTVHVINLRGAGRSVDQTDEYTYSMDDAIHDLEAIRESLRFDEWTFSGYSTGGFLALKYAVICPGSLTKIIAGGLCASYEYMEHPSTIYCKDSPSNQRMKEIFAELRKPETPREERIVLSKEWIMMSLYRKDAYYELLNRKESGRTLMSKIDYFTSVLKDYDVREEWKKTPVKAHIYCGRHDAQCLHVFSEEVADLIPNGSLTTFEYSNHSPAIEEEEKFKTFLKSTISRACSSLINQYKRSYYLENHNHKRIEYRRRISQRLSHNATVENTFG